MASIKEYLAAVHINLPWDIPPTMEWPLKFCAAMTVTVYILSLITGNVSQVDRVWTFLPTIYTAYFALLPLWPHTPPSFLWPYTPWNAPARAALDYSPRALLMLGLVTLWMFRLSYNTYRRGLFSFTDEDYRWAVLRKQLGPFLFQITNFFFIAIIQNVLLFALGLPTQTAVLSPHEPLTTRDLSLAGAALLTLIIEFTADNQQNAYQTFKYSASSPVGDNTNGVYNTETAWPGARIGWTGEDARRGFITRGLWAWSRHPNFACEQTFWIIITMFPLSPAKLAAAAATRPALTPLTPLAPALALCALFFSSTLFSEKISSDKYPAYRDYQQRVSMFVPVLTPVWGLLAKARGLGIVDERIWGKGEKGKDKAE